MKKLMLAAVIGLSTAGCAQPVTDGEAPIAAGPTETKQTAAEKANDIEQVASGPVETKKLNFTLHVQRLRDIGLTMMNRGYTLESGEELSLEALEESISVGEPLLIPGEQADYQVAWRLQGFASPSSFESDLPLCYLRVKARRLFSLEQLNYAIHEFGQFTNQLVPDSAIINTMKDAKNAFESESLKPYSRKPTNLGISAIRSFAVEDGRYAVRMRIEESKQNGTVVTLFLAYRPEHCDVEFKELTKDDFGRN